MISGPQMACMVQEFEDIAGIGSHKESLHHHEQTAGTQLSFLKEVKSLVSVLKLFGNPFMEQSSYLLALDSKVIADGAVTATVRGIQQLGQDQYQLFVHKRLKNGTKSL